MAFRLKNTYSKNTSTPFYQRTQETLDSIGKTTTNTPEDPTPDPRLQIELPKGSANYQVPVNYGASTISAPTPDDGALQQIGTLLSNPFDGIRALGNQARGGIREAFGMRDEGDRSGVYGSLTSLRRANESDDAETQKALERSSAFNSASQVAMLASGTALGAQTVTDLLQGDPTAAVIKKAKVIKPIYKAVKKVVDPSKLTKAAYMGYKTNKNL